jgi:peptidase C39-like protein
MSLPRKCSTFVLTLLLLSASLATPGCGFFCHLFGNCPDPCQQASPSSPSDPSCSSTTTPLTGQATLGVVPTFQQTEVWCWAASAEMVFRYYNLPNLNTFGNYQCGIVGSWFGGACATLSCGFCQSPVGPMSNEYQVLVGYGRFVQSFGIPSRVLSASLIFRALTASEVKTEIDAGRPIVVGIAPGGGFALPNASQHIAVLVGYSFSGSTQTVVVNDPFPFDLFPYNQMPHPYLSRGGTRLQTAQFRIPIDALTNGLLWANTIYQIQ